MNIPEAQADGLENLMQMSQCPQCQTQCLLDPEVERPSNLFRCPLVFAHRNFRILGLTAFLLAVLPKTIFSQLDHELPPAEQKEAGAALAQKWRDAVPGESAEYKGALKIRNNEGHTETIALNFKLIAGKPSWQTIYEAAPTSTRPGQKLVIIHTPGKPNEYLAANGTKPGEPAGQPAPLKIEQTYASFAGSDFWLIDLGLEFFHWPGQRLIKTEMRKGQVTKVLESVNPLPVGYSRVLTWLEKESGAPILAEAYDREGKLLKEFSLKSVKKVKGQYQLQEMQIRDVRSNSRTRIEYDFEKE